MVQNGGSLEAKEVAQLKKVLFFSNFKNISKHSPNRIFLPRLVPEKCSILHKCHHLFLFFLSKDIFLNQNLVKIRIINVLDKVFAVCVRKFKGSNIEYCFQNFYWNTPKTIHKHVEFQLKVWIFHFYVGKVIYVVWKKC